MKEVCKNCQNSSPTYKGVMCDVKRKKVKTQGTCPEWREKRK